MDLDLKVNFCNVSLGMDFDVRSLANASIGKIGFLTKAFMPVQKQPGETLYWAKNPSISCFGERVLGMPCLDRSMGAGMMNATSAYLFFNRNRLRYVIFQIIGSYIAATQFTNTFRAVASELLGQPEKLNYTQLPSTVMGITGYEPFHLQFVWRSEGESLVSEIGQSGKNAFVHWQISVEGTDMQELMMAFIRIQKCMDLILCGKLKQNGEVVDQDAAAVTFRHIISEATVPEEQRQTVNHYIEALRGDPEVRRVFGHAARVKTMMMAKTGQLTQGFRYQMHLKALGLPVESERQDVISPTEFFSLVGEFETYAQPFRDAIASDPDTMARIRKNYEDGS